MRSIAIFAEDFGHEAFLSALLHRLASEHGEQIGLMPRSVRGGCGPVLTQLKQALHDIERGWDPLPDLFVAATDSNCEGYAQRKAALDNVTKGFKTLVVAAIPDPHIERWLLLDSHAFKSILGKGCMAPDLKCDKDRYKLLLRQACMDAGVRPAFGGIEFAEDIVKVMDLRKMETADASLGKLITKLRGWFEKWRMA